MGYLSTLTDTPVEPAQRLISKEILPSFLHLCGFNFNNRDSTADTVPPFAIFIIINKLQPTTINI